MINSASKTTSTINGAFLHKKFKLKMQFINKAVLVKLQNLGLIKNFQKKPDFFSIVLNRTMTKNVKIHTYYRTHSKLYISKTQILKKRIHLFSTVYILSTPFGLLTQYEALCKNSGGFIISKITLS